VKAIEYSRTGPADVLELVERSPGAIGPDDVLVRIAVSGVNPTDWKSRQGWGDPTPLPHPQVPGQDGAGVVDSVGANVTRFSPGDRVWVWDAAYRRTDGTTQELAVVPVERVVALAHDASFDVGASVGIPALTAHRALTSRETGPARLAPGSLDGVLILVAGGAGAVGHAAIQLAIWAGATVITTVSSDDKAALAAAAGAHHVINYKTEDVAARVHEISPAGVDIVVEVSVNNIELDLDILSFGGTISLYASSNADEPSIPVRAAMTKNARLQFILTYTTSDAQKLDAVEAVSHAIRDRVLGIGAENGLPILRFPLEQAADAHKAVEDNFVGKVLIDVDSAAIRSALR
jgi:NADPH2:quinone reductase